ncbi:MAG TPA: GNAT family N-acetyltransferase [Nocardioidaceae bacterium]|nr:GNAT family N-acetyltransferase [Nocardioidaceae bacterium]
MTHVLMPAPADVLLTDGRVATIRVLTPADAEGLTALHEGVGEHSLRLRFFSANVGTARQYAAHLLDGADDTVLTLVAVLGHRIVAEASAERVGPDTAEVAFLVADDVHGLGLGSLLLEHLAAGCRELGITAFVADVLADNSQMLRVFLDAGFTVTKHSEYGVVEFRISTEATSAAVRAADEREFHAETASLRPLLYSRSVAVLGVRRTGGGIGNAVLSSIVAGGFTGDLYVVHPQPDEVQGLEGLTLLPRLTDVATDLDLVMIAVPARHVLDALRDAVAAKAAAAVVISSGFSELGEEGAQIQRDLLRIARENSIRLVGPNCLGVLSNDPAIKLNATFTKASPPEGGLAIASQSGGVGIAMLDMASDLGLGVHSFISLGNKADVSGNDLLAAWYNDDHVRVAALYLESFGNAAKFARIARRFAERKPILAVVGGRSSGGVRAGASHTAAAAAPSVGVQALFAQAGVIGCTSASAMARTALLLTEQPLPRGSRIGIVSNAGGIGVLAADTSEDLGLEVPELSEPLRNALGSLVHGTIGTSNPVDLGAGADAHQLAGVAEAVLASGEVDALLVPIVATNVTDPTPLVVALTETRRRHPDTPVVLVAMGGLAVPAEGAPGVTVFDSPEEAVDAMAAASRYAAWLALPRDEPTRPDPTQSVAARSRAQALLEEATGGWVPAGGVSELLTPYGLAPSGTLCLDPLDAARAADELGFPVAVKVADETIVHKTDRGLVRVGIGSEAEVIAAVRAFEAELDCTSVPVLVQPVVSGVEIALGVVRDPGFGPLVMVAAGGTTTNILDDRTFLLPPVGRQDAARALRSLRIWPLLNGYRGSEPVDVAALEELICSLGRLSLDVPEIAELDLNPVMATPEGVVLVDVKMRLAEAAPGTDGVPRQLRMG